MYTVAVKRNFIAQHFLIGGDWGAENQLHSHHYQFELQLHGESLDHYGYMVDIVQIEQALEELVLKFQDKTLNLLPEFEGLNPSIEHFSRILCQQLAKKIQQPNVKSLTAKLWENDIAWASFQMQI
mgnify:CR=1 FL=1